ncbi:MAG: helix-turn-helix transcriptional regulator [Clostridia bacterium]|nr:helix-turn-helix transcriptional regulator [Clostridia bacterium]
MKNVILSSYSAKRPKNSSVSTHIHSANEFVYYNTCSGYSIIDNQTYEIKPNTFAIIPARTQHHEVHNKDGSLFYTGFYCEDLPIPAGVYDDDFYGNFKNLAHQIWEEFQSNCNDKKEMLNVLCQKLLIMLRRKANEPELQPKDLSFAKRYIEENYHSKIKFAELAENCGFGYDYFRHRFKAVYGVSPQQHLINIRLESAKKILESSSMNCTETAYSCGFSDAAQFSTMYKKRFGVAPKKDKNQVD